VTRYRFQLRRDSAADWTSHNPTLLDGEPGVEEGPDGDRMKIGDGVTAWNDLPYWDAGLPSVIDGGGPNDTTGA
jgi:hypothetical protein